jgi:hypothetical protein
MGTPESRRPHQPQSDNLVQDQINRRNHGKDTNKEDIEILQQNNSH